MVTATVLLDGHLTLRARLRNLLDCLLRLLVLGVESLSYSLKLLARLLLVPIGLADNAVFVTAFLTAEDGLVCTTRV